MKRKIKKRYLFLILLLYFLFEFVKGLWPILALGDGPPDPPDDATTRVSVSTDGHYALTSQANQKIVLWNLMNHTHRLISRHGNVMSPYFIKNTDDFMWQSIDPNPPKYIAQYGPMKRDEFYRVQSNKIILVTREGKQAYFMYFADPHSPVGYQKRPITPNTPNNDVLKEHPDDFDPNPYVRGEYKVDDLSGQQKLDQIAIQFGANIHNIVHVQDVQGHELLHFNNFPVYGEVMSSDLKTYISVDYNWSLYHGYGSSQKLMMLDNGGGDNGKSFTLTLSDDNRYLLTAGVGGAGDDINPDTLPVVTGQHAVDGNLTSVEYSVFSKMEGIVLWNAITGQPIRKFSGNAYKTSAVLSPCGNYVISGDENYRAYIWNIKKGTRSELWDPEMGYVVGQDKKTGTFLYSTKGLKKAPKAYKRFDDEGGAGMIAERFVDKTHYLQFNMSYPWAVLYSVNQLGPLQYFNLGTHPTPTVFDYSDMDVIDTSPKAHVLVMGVSSYHGGIIVYHYDPNNQTLKKVWVGWLHPQSKGENVENFANSA